MNRAMRRMLMRLVALGVLVLFFVFVVRKDESGGTGSSLNMPPTQHPHSAPLAKARRDEEGSVQNSALAAPRLQPSRVSAAAAARRANAAALAARAHKSVGGISGLEADTAVVKQAELPSAVAYGNGKAEQTPVGHEAKPFGLMRDTKTYPGASHTRMHGTHLGVRADGLPGYTPKSCPTNYDMRQELLGNGFFARLSDCLPLDRDIMDGRHRMCRAQTYDLDTMPTTSVIFVFYNENYSTLLRSIHSVLNRTPPKLLQEIILVDDGSDREDLGERLEEYIKLLPKVKIVRHSERMGLVKARLRGVEESTGDTFTVLDSHIEVEVGWAEPILARIADDHTRVIMPQIDGINQETLDPQGGGIGCSLGFLWNLIEHSIPIQRKFQAERKTPIDAVKSPAMAGGLFTAHRDFFWHLGGYDTKFGFWGTENLEFSFRIWQCGGTLECAPCSRIHHIFRKGGHPYSMPAGHVAKNKLRTASIWMDEYAFIVKGALEASNPSLPDMGSIEEMMGLRKRLQCKSFDWFLKEVYPEGVITDRSDVRAMGRLRLPSKNLCLAVAGASYNGGKVTVRPCSERVGQRWLFLSKTGDIRPMSNLELCVTSEMKLAFCDRSGAPMRFDINPATGLVRQPRARNCLTVSATGNLELDSCASGSNTNQVWQVDDYAPPAKSINTAAVGRGHAVAL